MLLAVAAAVTGGGPVATAVLRSADPASASAVGGPSDPEVLRGGAWIGVLERAAVAGTLLAGWPEGLAIVLAVKGLGRFAELRAPVAAERFILGTFASALWAGGLRRRRRVVAPLTGPGLTRHGDGKSPGEQPSEPGGPVSQPSSGALRNPQLLAVYCNDHLAASVGGMELVKRMLGEHRTTDYEGPLTQLLGELREENSSLQTQMRAMGFPVRRYKQAALWVGEKLSRVKLNGRLLGRSPLSDLVEFEFLASAVRAKRSGFETLREVAEVDDRLDRAELDRLIEQANRQHDWLTRARQEVAATIFGGHAGAAREAAD